MLQMTGYKNWSSFLASGSFSEVMTVKTKKNYSSMLRRTSLKQPDTCELEGLESIRYFPPKIKHYKTKINHFAVSQVVIQTPSNV